MSCFNFTHPKTEDSDTPPSTRSYSLYTSWRVVFRPERPIDFSPRQTKCRPG